MAWWFIPDRANVWMNWQEAIDYCAGLSFAGSSDWRLPASTELDSIVDYGRYYPAVNPVFKCGSDHYWSATTDAFNNNLAWDVNFYFGDDSWDDKSNHAYVRCVRGGL